MARRPKVFTWSDGFHHYFVAETSRAKALAAWGFDRDLFREGAAREISEGPGHDAALAKPGEVIEQVSGDIRKLAQAVPAKAKPKGTGKALAAACRTLAAAEAKLAALNRQHETEEAIFAQREDALSREHAAAESRFSRTQAKLRDQLESARAALKAAKGDRPNAERPPTGPRTARRRNVVGRAAL